jgi:multidrug efflux system membrane fusion protein
MQVREKVRGVATIKYSKVTQLRLEISHCAVNWGLISEVTDSFGEESSAMTIDRGIFYPLAVASLLLMLGLTGCRSKAQQGFGRPPAAVQVSEAIAQDVPTYLDAIGKTVAREVVSIQPQVSGRIAQIHFTDGANVKKGQLLFTIDPKPFEANVKEAQAKLSQTVALKKQAEANLARELAQANWGRVQVERYGKLVEQGVVPREQYEQLRANYDSLKATAEAARSAVSSADEAIKADAAAVESAKVQLSYCYIRSPIDGRAGQRLVDLGNVVTPGGGISGNAGANGTGNSNSLLVIERLDPIYADFSISQNNLTSVQEEMRAGTLAAEVRLPDSADEPALGQLTFLDNAVQTATGQVSLRATIPNAGHRFWPGRFVNIRLILSTIHQAVLVPANAPQMSAKGPFVYIVKSDSTAEQRPVTLGQRQGDLIVIEQGVTAGERVVTLGQLGVTPGGKVQSAPGPAESKQ